MSRVIVAHHDGEQAGELVDLIERLDAFAALVATLDEARAELKRSRADLLLIDTAIAGSPIDFLLDIPRRKVRLIGLMGGDELLDEALQSLRAERVCCVPQPVTRDALRQLLRGQCADDRPPRRRSRRKRGQAGEPFGMMLGDCDAMRRVYHMIARVAPTDATCLIVGESGTGKELVAKAIHDRSRRKDKPFIDINCGAIPENLLESELFGHVKGAFTGADRNRKGVFERAHGGTLFLDEITEMSAEMQVRLLRGLETTTLRRGGGEKESGVDVRVIAATNRDPRQAVDEEQLREDLLYRLSVFPIELPALRHRGDDVVLLANHFLSRHNEQAGANKHFSDLAVQRLRRYHWPGNVRQLRNVVQRSFIMAPERLDLTYLSKLIKQDNDDDAPMPVNAIEGDGETDAPAEYAANAANGSEIDESQVHIDVGTSIDDAERELIIKTLTELDGDKKEAARVLGISLKTLYNRLNEYKDAGREIEIG